MNISSNHNTFFDCSCSILTISILFSRDLYKLQKLFESRIKAQKEREAKEKHIPISLLYDEDNLTEVPPPLVICNTALESLKLFRVSGNLRYKNPHILIVQTF